MRAFETPHLNGADMEYLLLLCAGRPLQIHEVSTAFSAWKLNNYNLGSTFRQLIEDGAIVVDTEVATDPEPKTPILRAFSDVPRNGSLKLTSLGHDRLNTLDLPQGRADFLKSTSQKNQGRTWQTTGELPDSCPECLAPRQELSFSGTMEHHMGRRLQLLAPFASLSVLLGSIIWTVWADEGIDVGHGWGLGRGYLAFIAIPGLALYLASLLFPHVKHVSCSKCGWAQEVEVTS